MTKEMGEKGDDVERKTSLNLFVPFFKKKRKNKQFKPTHVLNAAGLTGRPNVDWCETHKVRRERERERERR